MKCNLHVKAEIAGRVVYEKVHDPWCLGICGLLHGYRYNMLSISIPDVGNTSRAWGVVTGRLDAGSGINTHGPVVGTGSTAQAWGDYNLVAKIAHGTGSGQLSHGAVSFNAPVNDGNDRYFEVLRTFTNGSGASITVYELGMIVYNATYYFLICRDVVSGGIEIPNGQALTLTYKVKISL